ncbi:MAG: VanZ family protein [Myxococcota bacterium]|jgi:VanZ family protein
MGKCNLAGPQTDGNAGGTGPSVPDSTGPRSGGRRLTPESTKRANTRLPRWLIVWGPAAGWAAVLFLLSELRGVPLNLAFATNDKLVHVALYGVLGSTLGWAVFVSRSVRWPGRSVPLVLAVAVGLLYGTLDEIHQAFVPNRMPSGVDWVANAVGVLVGCTVTAWLLTTMSNRITPSGGPNREMA